MSTNARRQTPEFSLLDPEVMRDPYPVLRQMREQMPVYWSEELQGWVLTRHADVSAAFRDPRFSAGGLRDQVRKQLRGHDPSVAEDFVRVREQMMLHHDGAEHLRRRRPGNSTFSRRNIEAFESRMMAATQDTLASLGSAESFDFATDVAEPLSTRIIAEVFDVPHRDREQFQRWSDDVSRFFGESLGDDVVADAHTANEGVVALERYFVELVDQRTRTPGHDLVSLLIEHQARLDIQTDEIIAQCVLIMMAGHFSTIDQMCNTMVALMEHAEVWRAIVRDPGRVAPTMEECIRWDGGVLFMARTLLVDVALGGRVLRAGESVFLGRGAANRDPDVYERPQALDVGRAKSRHLGFGYGPHQCLGAALARMEMKILFTELSRRFVHLRLDPDRPARRKCETLFFRGFYEVPLRCR